MFEDRAEQYYAINADGKVKFVCSKKDTMAKYMEKHTDYTCVMATCEGEAIRLAGELNRLEKE